VTAAGGATYVLALDVTGPGAPKLVELPFHTTYAPTKTGVTAFGHTLRRELRGYPASPPPP
jgi:hypothetical protein